MPCEEDGRRGRAAGFVRELRGRSKGEREGSAGIVLARVCRPRYRGTHHDPAQHLEEVGCSTAVHPIVGWRVRVFE